MSSMEELKAVWEEYAPGKDPRFILDMPIQNNRVYAVPVGLAISDTQTLPETCLVREFSSIDQAVEIGSQLNDYRNKVRAGLSPTGTSVKQVCLDRIAELQRQPT